MKKLLLSLFLVTANVSMLPMDPDPKSNHNDVNYVVIEISPEEHKRVPVEVRNSRVQSSKVRDRNGTRIIFVYRVKS